MSVHDRMEKTCKGCRFDCKHPQNILPLCEDLDDQLEKRDAEIAALTTERDTLKKKLERYREQMMNCICLGCREAEGFATQDTKPTEGQE